MKFTGTDGSSTIGWREVSQYLQFAREISLVRASPHRMPLLAPFVSRPPPGHIRAQDHGRGTLALRPARRSHPGLRLRSVAPPHDVAQHVLQHGRVHPAHAAADAHAHAVSHACAHDERPDAQRDGRQLHGAGVADAPAHAAARADRRDAGGIPLLFGRRVLRAKERFAALEKAHADAIPELPGEGGK